MAWQDDDSIRIEILGEFAEATARSTADVTRLRAVGMHVRQLSHYNRPPGRSGDEMREYKRLKKREYEDRDRCAPPSDATRAALRKRMTERKAMRERLPGTRAALTQHFTIMCRAPEHTQVEGEQPKTMEVDGYITVGLYDDGRLGEFFVRVGRGAEQFGPSIDRWAEAVSKALQHGVPLEVMLNNSVASIDEIAGVVTGVVGIKRCSSPHDLIARWLLMKYGTKKKEEVQP